MIGTRRLMTLVLSLAVVPATAIAQNMEHTVVEQRVSFPRGKTSTLVTGDADYAMSYVYRLKARAGQAMRLKLSSKSAAPRFSVIAPDGVTLDNGFGVRGWEGRLPQSGDYTVVVVMNDKKLQGVSYKLQVEIN